MVIGDGGRDGDGAVGEGHVDVVIATGSLPTLQAVSWLGIDPDGEGVTGGSWLVTSYQMQNRRTTYQQRS